MGNKTPATPTSAGVPGAPAGKFFNTPPTIYPQYTSGSWANLPPAGQANYNNGQWSLQPPTPAPAPAPSPTPTPTPTPTPNHLPGGFQSVLDHWRASHGLPPGGFVSLFDLLRARHNPSQTTTQMQSGLPSLFGWRRQ